MRNCVDRVGARTTPVVFGLLQVPVVRDVHDASGVNALGMPACCSSIHRKYYLSGDVKGLAVRRFPMEAAVIDSAYLLLKSAISECEEFTLIGKDGDLELS